MLKIKLTGLLCIAFAINCLAQTPVKSTPQWRPLYHFTPPVNWTNDPNGLLFLNGKFNLYYQHNPFENKWGHMSWGHATSSDLVNWKNLPVAIPEMIRRDTITMIYSGSAVLDKNNTSGFGSLNNPPVVAIYTADLRNQHKEKQYVAYSNDGGLTFKQYAKNPVIDLDKEDFRDPNVFWYAPTKQWIMTVAMVDEHQVRIYGSKNLKEWTKLSDFGPAGFIKNPWECPSLLPLMVNDNPAKVKWVLLVSAGGEHGPLMQYYVGDFDGHTFKNDNAADKVLMVDYGDAFYAAIAWRDAPANKKILLGWLQNGKPETSPWRGQMSIPRELSLKTTADGLRLIQQPASIVTGKLLGKPGAFKSNIVINNKSMPLFASGHFDGNAYWIDAELNGAGYKKAGFNVAEKNGAAKKVVVGYDAVKQELFIDCTSAENDNKSAEHLVQTAPMKPVNGVVKIQVLMDKSSLEVIGNGGEKVISTMIYPDTDATGLSVFTDGEVMVKSLKIWDLNKK
ncbi:glycoside hydrolase family 32 protein [Mucilaginibacter sp. OK098]|uniref:glycoside hydrolase family 32 protein n=1 Tax=Mucilaginibacter sp. OK098 TaxID=1855297 RepID=UPI000916A2AD|nr:glycoside hydrolase family 32 protein [Mucilaginibacter sp. OK098]SHM91818.1 levanase [Mucilaginibacter sp. OK098]